MVLCEFGASLLFNPISLTLFFFSTGWNDVSWHNPLIKTPVLERYAKAGVILNASYVTPICSP
jgi:arylsulfatase A-like enzyme